VTKNEPENEPERTRGVEGLGSVSLLESGNAFQAGAPTKANEPENEPEESPGINRLDEPELLSAGDFLNQPRGLGLMRRSALLALWACGHWIYGARRPSGWRRLREWKNRKESQIEK
jgi:hypothetical protein